MKCENCNYFRQLDDEYSAECLKFNLRTKYYNSSEWKCLKDGYKKAGWEMKTKEQVLNWVDYMLKSNPCMNVEDKNMFNAIKYYVTEKQTDGDLINRKAVLDCFDGELILPIRTGKAEIQKYLQMVVDRIKELSTIPQTTTAEEKICHFNSDSEVIEYCVEGPCKHLKECPYAEELPTIPQTATCNECVNKKECIMSAPDGHWKACDDFVPQTIPQTDSVLEDIKAEIEKLPRIKVGNSNSPTVKYCIDERLIYEVFDKHINRKE